MSSHSNQRARRSSSCILTLFIEYGARVVPDTGDAGDIGNQVRYRRARFQEQREQDSIRRNARQGRVVCACRGRKSVIAIGSIVCAAALTVIFRRESFAAFALCASVLDIGVGGVTECRPRLRPSRPCR